MKFSTTSLSVLFLLAALATSTTTSGASSPTSSTSSTTKNKKTRGRNDLLKDALFLSKDDLPNTGEAWQSMPNGIEFQPAANLSPLAETHLRQLTGSGSGSGSGSYFAKQEGAFEKMFVDGGETYYDEYAQAWRALGFFIDCDWNDEDRRRRGRKLQDGEDDEGSCQRFMLWAAYVDEAYSGNGVGEYMYYDRKNDKWDETACAYEASKRCVPMDCHLSNTHFSLLGFFKEPNYGEWMEQLFKHEGDCVWTDEEYQFMQQMREVWPEECTATSQTVTGKDGASYLLYYDIKPGSYGEYAIGLYTDSKCMEEYAGTDLTVDQVFRAEACGDEDGGDNDGGDVCSTGLDNWLEAWNKVRAAAGPDEDGGGDDDRGDRNMWSLAGQLDTWNRGFDVWKQCQPCKTYDLTAVVAGYQYEANAKGLRYDFSNWDNNVNGEAAEQDGDGGEDDEDTFHCRDAAGYDNVNQCMKFKTKTKMLTASWTDIEMSIAQGGISSVSIPAGESSSRKSKTYGTHQTYGLKAKQDDVLTKTSAYLVAILSLVLFVASAIRFVRISTDKEGCENDDFVLIDDEPLIASAKGVAA